ncbi:Proton-dependent oligopeptide transporter family,Major facilitator superfamily domain [Cinara cedri]|uniref:Proton-dependent oligopeptide transporter family,Major facilitator superfamily domain n=1 Tax=Cinara cedri TaxID=506608 RepID=A0A5E4MUE8_9HEMI|nr:Proton-dependent oligopeptide transporter family,Major facilitator superfamily domain [Cinara cedri]
MEIEPVKNQLKTPKSLWYIICHTLCEQVNFSGIKAIMVLHLTSELNYTQDDSMMIFHSFMLMSYLMPLCGAIFADSYWGKYKTLIRLSVVYAIGNVILTGSTMADNFSFDTQRYITIAALLIISIGNGGIKPCTYTFGGDQFQLPEQKDQLATFFNRFLIAVYLGILLAKFFIPELRASIHCFGRDSCFPLAFGVSTLCLLLGIGGFFMGRNLYIKRKPENHVIFRTFGCICYAIYKKITSKSDNAHHWLDRSKDKYTLIEISDTKAALDVIHIFIAFPVFNALYEQQFSRWTFQATLMNGKIEAINWEIKPDQMQTIYPFLSLIVLFYFKSTVYPFFAKFGIRTPLQKLILCHTFAVFAFMSTTILQYVIFGEITTISRHEGRFSVYNDFNCNVHINSSTMPIDDIVESLGTSNFKCTPTFNKEAVNITLKFDNSCSSYHDKLLYTEVTISKGKSISYLLTRTLNNDTILRSINNHDDLKKSKNGNPRLRILMNNNLKTDRFFELTIPGKKYFTPYQVSSFASEHFKEVAIGNYTLRRGGEVISTNIRLMPATIYTLLIHNDSRKLESKLFASDRGNHLHVLWQLPQYVFIVFASTIFFSTSVQFSFTEAPLRIKSFIAACSFLAHSAGNLIVVLTSSLSIEQQVHEYLFFTGLMFLDTLLLAYLSSNYKYKTFKQRTIDFEKGQIINENTQIKDLPSNKT